MKSFTKLHNKPSSFNSRPTFSQSQQKTPAISENKLKLIRKKIANVDSEKQISFLKDRICQFYGTNYPISYKKEYGFEQKWQNAGWRPPPPAQHVLRFQTKIEVLLNLWLTLSSTLAIWLSTIKIVLSSQISKDITYPIYFCALLSHLIEIVTCLGKNSKRKRNRSYSIKTAKDFSKNILASVFFVFQLAFTSPQTNFFFCIFEIVVLVTLYFEMSKRYHSIRVMNFSHSYEHHFKVFDLILTLLIIAHIMALVLFSSTKAGYDTTWLSKAGLQSKDPLLIYLYSFYFATTTILTVGYGDITAANPLEMITVSFVQICGIIILGFIISQIGFCVSSLRKRSELLQKELQIIERMKNYYKLNNNIVNRVNQYLINSYEKAALFTPDQEKYVVNKLNEQLRNQLTQINLLSIVKSSVFMLCRWTKSMQNSVALKMQHTLFSPNNAIYQPPGKQRLYFIKSGSIGIYTSSHKIKQLLKTISNSLQNEVANNSYGYTHIMIKRKVRFQAVAKEFTSAYYIQKDKFKQSVLQSPLDFEYYHEIINKLQVSRVPQAIEVTSFLSRRQHYNPNRIYLIKKENSQVIKNKRRYYLRSQQKFKCVNMIQVSNSIINFHRSHQILAEQSIQLSKDSPLLISIANSQVQKECQTDKSMKSVRLKDSKKLEWHRKWIVAKQKFQSGREYKNYYPKSNKNQVLLRQERQNNLLNAYGANRNLKLSQFQIKCSKDEKINTNLQQLV